MLSSNLSDEAARVLARLRDEGLRVVTAESCTGGLICAALTSVAGSSDVVDRGFVTYSNESKTDMLGVSAKLILERGAVSHEVAEAMALGALSKATGADLGVSVTGIAGPGGGSEAKPVGLVYIGAVRRGGRAEVREFLFGDIGRDQVRVASVLAAFEMVRQVSGSG